MDVSKAVEKIYKSYFFLFVSIGKRNYALNNDVVKDMIQETFIKLWKNKQNIKANDEAGVRNYALSVFRNTCISQLRKSNLFIEKDCSEQDQDGSPEESMEDKRSNPLSEILLIEEMRLQEVAIKQLPPKYRNTVKLSLEGMKRRDIAKKLGIKESTIRNLKHRGLKKYEKIIIKMDPLRKN